MSADPADGANPSRFANTTTVLPGLQLAEVNESMGTTRGTKVRGRPIITSPYAVVESAQVNVEGQIGATKSTTPPWKEQIVLPDAYPERINYPSTGQPELAPSRRDHGFDFPPDDVLKASGGSTSDDGSHSSSDVALYESSRRETTVSEDTSQPIVQTPIASLSKPADLPRIHVQQPTRDPSEAEDMLTQRRLEPETAEVFVKSPIRRISVSPDITTAAPEVPTAVTDLTVAQPFQDPTGLPQLFTASKSRRLLRRARNRVVGEPLLELVLGRSVAKVAKPALRFAAHPTTEPLFLPEHAAPVAR